jgi:hypothetical protein
MIDRRRILFEDTDEGPEWVAVYYLGTEELDDSFEETDRKEAIFNAIDFDAAVRYAQQYMRKMQSDEETSEDWKDAQILSVELR